MYRELHGFLNYFRQRIGSQDADDAYHDLIFDLVDQIHRDCVRDPWRVVGYAKTIAKRKVAAWINERMKARCNEDVTEWRPAPERFDTFGYQAADRVYQRCTQLGLGSGRGRQPVWGAPQLLAAGASLDQRGTGNIRKSNGFPVALASSAYSTSPGSISLDLGSLGYSECWYTSWFRPKRK